MGGNRDIFVAWFSPGDKELKTSGSVHVGNVIKYIAKRSDCAICPLQPHCTTSSARRVQRDVHQEAHDYTQSLMETEAYGASSIGRKKIEARHCHVNEKWAEFAARL